MSAVDPFEDYLTDYSLTDASLEIFSEDESRHLGTIDVAELECSEGRHLSFVQTGDAWDAELQYRFFFQTPDPEEPEGGFEASRMTVHIVGTHPSGCTLQLTGVAYLYLEAEGSGIVGTYLDPPLVMVLSGLPETEPDGKDRPSAKILPFRRPA